MSKDSRTKNTIRNSSVAVGGQLLNTLLSFVSRTVFIYILGRDYLGVHGLFSNILTVLSLAELGIGDAITYKLYTPLAEDDYESVKKYMTFYKNAYLIIGIVVFSLGTVVTPFLHVFIKEMGDLKHVQLIYFLYLIETSSTYFFAHKKLIFSADQKNYVVTVNRYIFLILRTILQIVFLLLFQNFIVYLVVQIIVNFAENVAISIKSNKSYPYILERGAKLDQEEKKEIFKQTSALVMHKVGGVCVSGTDNILISSFIGISVVGIYSNYTTVLLIPSGILSHVFAPLTASIGNLISAAEKKHVQETFNKLFLINFWLYGFSAIALFTLINSFVGEVWLDASYLLDTEIVFVIVLNFYLTGMRQVVSSFKSAAGLFWNDRYRSLCEAAVNLIASIVLFQFFGLIGILIGTTVSTLTTTFWVEAVIVYRKVLHINPLRFFTKYVFFFVVTLMVGFLVYFVCGLIPFSGIVGFLLKGVACVVLVNLCFVVLFCRTEEFLALRRQFGKNFLRK